MRQQATRIRMLRALPLGVFALLTACSTSSSAPTPMPSASVPAASRGVRMAPTITQPVPMLPPRDPARAKAAPFERETPTPELLACLRRHLPHEFTPGRRKEAEEGLARCLPKSKDELFYSGLKQFRFARDPRNGLEVEVRVFCSDVCPAYTRTSIVYADVKSVQECSCIGGEASIDAGWGSFIGCTPSTAERDAHVVLGRDFTFRQNSSQLYPGTRGWSGGSILDSVGLHNGAELVSLNGHAFSGQDEIAEILQKLPNAPPLWLGVRMHRGNQDGLRELHFIDEPTLRALSSEIEIAQREAPNNLPCHTMVMVNNTRACADPTIDGVAVWVGVAKKIEQVAQSHRRSLGTPAAGLAACRRLGALPTLVSLETPERSIELRYVNWLR